MLEFQLVDHPMVFPQKCVACNSATGPQLDTHVELPAWGWVYLCMSCAKRAAIAFGFAPGERMDELSLATGFLLEKEREIAVLLEEAEQNVSQIKQLQSSKQTMTTLNEELSGRVSQLETSIRESAEDARRHLELVGGVA